ncbi:MAG TPA: recombinase family protein [Bryobacteraceae bacterium]|nr:recombinase family protein [Bryobacteraceae bacterium]
MQVGYARVSTADQDTAVQVAALKTAGCERIIVRKRPAGIGTGRNFIESSINFAKVMCLSSGIRPALSGPSSKGNAQRADKGRIECCA